MSEKENYTDTQLLKAYDALQDIKMFFQLNERQREGLKIAQSVLMEQISKIREEK